MNTTLENLLADTSFVLWLKGEGSADQREYWNNWLKEDPDRHRIVREAKEIIEAIDSEYETPNPHTELEKLDHTIDQYERRINQKHRKVIGNIPEQYDKGYQTIGIRVAAAAILILVILGSVMGYYLNRDEGSVNQAAETVEPLIEEYHTDYGEKLTFRLSDGSQITLNANSDLKFSSKIEKGLNTEVWLEGEAYFDIAHLEGEQLRTFTVHTDDGSIQVLGTRFAVNTFRGVTRTVLEEGKVNISNSGSSASYELAPGELAQFKSNDNKIAVKKVNTRIIPRGPKIS
jgi:ferric-dicitrate binding protein FerR (iron transport regulator)